MRHIGDICNSTLDQLVTNEATRQEVYDIQEPSRAESHVAMHDITKPQVNPDTRHAGSQQAVHRSCLMN